MVRGGEGNRRLVRVGVGVWGGCRTGGVGVGGALGALGLGLHQAPGLMEFRVLREISSHNFFLSGNTDESAERSDWPWLPTWYYPLRRPCISDGCIINLNNSLNNASNLSDKPSKDWSRRDLSTDTSNVGVGPVAGML